MADDVNLIITEPDPVNLVISDEAPVDLCVIEESVDLSIEDNSDVTLVISEPEPVILKLAGTVSSVDKLVKVSVDDTDSGYLLGKLISSDGSVGFAIDTPGGDENFDLSVDHDNTASITGTVGEYNHPTDANMTVLNNTSNTNTGDQASSDFTHNDLGGLNDGATYQHITTTQETNFESAYSHITADGSSHTYIDQSVVSGATPTFTGTNFTGMPTAGITGVLTDDSMADTLHRHSELSASDGSPNPALQVDADGNVAIEKTTPRLKVGDTGGSSKTLVMEANNTDDASYLKATTGVVGGVGKAVDVDGSDYVTLPDINDLDFDFGSPFSFHFWVNVNSFASFSSYLNKILNLSSSGWLFVDYSSGGHFPAIYTYDTGVVKLRARGTTSVGTGAYTHIAFTYDGSNSTAGMTFYVNGAGTLSSLTNNAGTSMTNAEVVKIAKKPPSVFGDGDFKIDELVFYNKELTGGEITAIYAGGAGTYTEDDANTVGIYHFDSDLMDSSSNSNDGSSVGSPSYVTGVVTAPSTDAEVVVLTVLDGASGGAEGQMGLGNATSDTYLNGVDLSFKIGGVEQWNIDSNGNLITTNALNKIGIGTASPARALDVNSSTGVAIRHPSVGNATLEFLNATTRKGLVFYNDGDGTFNLWDGSNKGICLDGAGNVGIGTDTPNTILDVKTSVAGSALIQQWTADDNGPVASISKDGSDNGVLIINKGTSAGGITLRSVGDSWFDNGNVGIGTKTPARIFQVSDNTPIIRIEDSDATTATQANTFFEMGKGSGGWARAGYFGFSSAGNADLAMVNEVSNGDVVIQSAGSAGDILLNAGGAVKLQSDNRKLYFGTDDDASITYDGTDLILKTDEVAASDFIIDCGTEKTIRLVEVVYKDINLGAASLGGPVSGRPDTVEFVDETGTDTGIYTYGFDTGEKLSGNFELQHDYKEGTDLAFHIHWQGDDAPTGTDKVKWQLTYTISHNGDTLNATTPITIETDIDTAYAFNVSELPDISGVGLTIGDQFLFTLERIAASVDEYGGDAITATVGIHYQVDTLGSRQLFIK